MSQSGGDDGNDSAVAGQELLELIGAGWKSQAVYVAAELRIADFLAERSMTAGELAQLTQAHPVAMAQLLRALTTIGVCRESAAGSFALTSLGMLLTTDHAQSLRSWAVWWGSQLWPVWGQLLYSVKTGQSARKLLLGTEGFEHLELNPALAATFHEAATEMTRWTAADVVRAYDFSGLKRIVDVGGGRGELLAAILQAAPRACGVLFDLPRAVEQAREHLAALGLAARCEFITGSFFETVPTAGDAYLLKSVLHDWNDQDAGRILETCRRAMDQANLLVLEEVLPDHMTTSPAHQAAARSDLNMLVTHAARERTAGELRSLLSEAGFRVLRVIPAGLTFQLIEAVPDSVTA